MAYFGLKLGQDLGNRVAHPYQEFRGVPPPPPGANMCSSRNYPTACVTRSTKEINRNTAGQGRGGGGAIRHSFSRGSTKVCQYDCRQLGEEE